jgi:hypothetical protein
MIERIGTMATITIYNTLHSRLQTVDLEFTDSNTTWFEDASNDHDIYMITDAFGGLVISERGYDYPLWFDGVSREKIGYSKRRAKSLKTGYINSG